MVQPAVGRTSLAVCQGASAQKRCGAAWLSVMLVDCDALHLGSKTRVGLASASQARGAVHHIICVHLWISVCICVFLAFAGSTRVAASVANTEKNGATQIHTDIHR